MAGTDSGVGSSGVPNLAPLAFGAVPWYDVQAAAYNVYGDGSPAAVNLNALLAAIGSDSATLLFRAGTYRLDANVTIPANVTLKRTQGAVLSMDADVTLTINGPVESPLTRAFSGAGSVSFATNEVLEAIFPEWWYEGGGDWHDAIMGACNSLPGYRGIPIRFVARRYDILTPLVMPGSSIGAEFKAVIFEGVGGGAATSKPTLRFMAATGPDTVQWDFSNVADEASEIVIRNLQLEHGGAEAQASHGIGIKLHKAYHHVFEDLWITGFNVGMVLTQHSFYGQFNRVKFINNYNCGFRSDAEGMLNGTEFHSCQFSGSLEPGVGVGCELLNAGSSTVFRGCWFEGNRGMGLSIAAVLVVGLDGCYFESNRSYDISARSGYGHMATLVTLSNSYFDLGGGIPYTVANRINSEHVRWLVTGCRFYQKDTQTGAPFNIPYKVAGAPCVALNNEYDTAQFTTNADDAGWFIVDDKHPAVFHAANLPTGRTSVARGDFTFNTDADVTGILGWVCTGPGATADIAELAGLTVSCLSGSSVLTGAGQVENYVTRGDYITVAGLTFEEGALFARVIAVEPGPVYKMDRLTAGSVSGAAITYQRATFQAINADTVAQTIGFRVAQQDTTVTASIVEIFAGAEVGGEPTTNLSLISGQKAFTLDATFSDLVLWTTNGTVVVLGGSVQGAPAARSYAVSGVSLQLQMAADTYLVSVKNERKAFYT